jgi:SAM-dependent methyltransferase
MNLLKRIKSKIFEIGLFNFICFTVRYSFINKKKTDYQAMLSKDSNKEKFTEIYKKNFWHSSESGSGMGSEVIYTEKLRLWLLNNLPEYDVSRFVDAACGDFNWMKLVVPKLNVEYYGFDIVDSVIEENIAKYSNDQIHFAVADICNDKLPDCDFLMIRDCLFHLSFHDINSFLINLSQTNYRFLLTTTHILQSDHINEDIISGHFRHIDLFKKPFNFKERKIVERFEDAIKGFTPREMILIAKENVPKNLDDE